ncbi:WD40-repeat-containing domain protein [Gongronella butleri]|nr:WD40-repeat-containing domain protein [Gongronella butleri]
MTTRPTLAPIETDSTVFDFDLHPSQDLIVSGLITGKLQCHRYGETHDLVWDDKPFKKSCRGINFSPDGSKFYAISKDRSILTVDTLTGSVMDRRDVVHEQPLNALLCMGETLLATGDDLGVIKLWDTRKKVPIQTWQEHEDYIAQMAYNEDKKTLVAVGGDGYLSTWHIRKPEVAAMSDHMEDELLSVVLVKNNQRAVVGSQEGVLSIWDWGDFGDYKDRIMGHPESISALCKLDEDTVCTGSSDGLIRLVSILPNEFHGILGDHGEEMPIEHIRLAHDKRFIVSSGHDQSMRFWNVEHLFQEDEENEDNGNDDETLDNATKDDDELAPATAAPVDDDDAQDKQEAPVDDNDGDEQWQDDSDDSDAGKDKKKRKKKQKQAPTKKKGNKTAFFADL